MVLEFPAFPCSLILLTYWFFTAQFKVHLFHEAFLVLSPPAGNHLFLWIASIGLASASTQVFWLELLFLFTWLTIFDRLGARWEQDPHLNHHCVPRNIEHWALHLEGVLDYLKSIWNHSHPASPTVSIAGKAENYISQNPVATRGITSFRTEGSHYFLGAVAGRWGSSCEVPSSFQATSLKIICSSSAAWGGHREPRRGTWY